MVNSAQCCLCLIVWDMLYWTIKVLKTTLPEDLWLQDEKWMDEIYEYVGKVKYLRYALYIQYLLHLKNAYTVNTGNNSDQMSSCI